MEVQQAQKEHFTPAYSLARCLKGYLCHVLPSNQSFPKYQQAEEEYSNSINCCMFPPDISKDAQTLHCLAVLQELETRSWDYCHALSPASAQRDLWHPRLSDPGVTAAEEHKHRPGGMKLADRTWVETWVYDEVCLGVQGGKRRELVRNAACVTEKIKRHQSWIKANKQLGKTI